jgi:Tfp pilus assembly protein PilF
MTYVYRGHVYVQLGDPPAAAQAYQRALAIDPKNALALEALRNLKR